MKRHLILRLEGPLVAFGAPIVDNFGVVQDTPAASMLTGLLANALGWSRGDGDRLNVLQSRLVFGTRLDRPGRAMQDFQTAQLAADDRAWTTHGRPEGRAGGASTYKSPHLRHRDYHADACVAVALRLEPPDDTPDLDDIAHALEAPERPLFLGRKTCLPTTPILAGECLGDTVLQALRTAPSLAADGPERLFAVWPEGEGEVADPSRTRRFPTTDQRDWAAGVHGGQRWLLEAQLPGPAVEGAEP